MKDMKLKLGGDSRDGLDEPSIAVGYEGETIEIGGFDLVLSFRNGVLEIRNPGRGRSHSISVTPVAGNVIEVRPA